ncbi:MAG: hypothetical protein ACETWK_06615, partial [Candidatus Aminicenantaceae bacterium]
KQRIKGNIQKKNKEIDSKKKPLFRRLGEKINELRPDNEELAIFYSQIDRADNNIQDLEDRIENL